MDVMNHQQAALERHYPDDKDASETIQRTLQGYEIMHRSDAKGKQIRQAETGSLQHPGVCQS